MTLRLVKRAKAESRRIELLRSMHKDFVAEALRLEKVQGNAVVLRRILELSAYVIEIDKMIEEELARESKRNSY